VSGDNGTFGVFIIDGMPRFVSCELPWKDNQRNISCVPAGTYPIMKMYSPRFQKTVYMIADIPGRDAVEIHIGNTIKDSHGCILIGIGFGATDYLISGSTIAFGEFMNNFVTFTSITIKDSDDVKTIITNQV
jgi:hypothetical protein